MSNRQFSIKNDLVSVCRKEILPGQSLSIATSAADRIIIGLNGGSIQCQEADGKCTECVLDNQEAHHLSSATAKLLHSNQVGTPIQIMIIEMAHKPKERVWPAQPID